MSHYLYSQKDLYHQIDMLTQQDNLLANLVHQHGYPPFWQRPQTFATLIHIILEQQVSLASALACFNKLATKLKGSITPESFLSLTDGDLRTLGFSRQKTAYGRNLAQAILNQTLKLPTLSTLSDDKVRAQLTTIKGIGNWTADVYLMMCLGRPDHWPIGDRALAVSVKEALELSAVPKKERLAQIGEAYRPYRTAAAFLFWHRYLQTR